MLNRTLNAKEDALLALIKNFYTLTGMRIVVYDCSFQKLLAYPASHCYFCKLMHDNPTTCRLCKESDQNSFRRCQQSGMLEIYHCHAGLVEATAPLMDNGGVIGYIMFGQISDNASSAETLLQLQDILEKHHLQPPDDPALLKIVHKTPEQIYAAANILEACTFYVVLKDLVAHRSQNFVVNLNNFLKLHLAEDLSVERLMDEFQISRNKLYDYAGEYLNMGIAEYIKHFRLEEAKRLLTETTLPICEISDIVGFNDYNYFCRSFKKETGSSARQYRNHIRKQPAPPPTP